MSRVQYNRQPCPGRIFEDLGNGFAIGCAGGSLFYFFKGMLNSPKGQRFLGGVRHVRNRAGLLGGSFAMWGGIFSCTDCMLISVRKKDDPYNAVVAGALTGGMLAIRGGLSVAFKQALAGGFILAMIEGVSIAFSAIQMRQQQEAMKEMMKQEEAHRTKMTRMGGENPWEVDINKESQAAQSGLEQELTDNAAVLKENEEPTSSGNSMLKKFSF